MNKAKIMLSAIAILGLVGGVFAFKATRFLPSEIFTSYATTVAGANTILCKITKVATTDVGPVVQRYTSASPASICGPLVNVRTIAAND
jgi:protein-S-isoprenylcysteine O-methyltransferase Ste14